MFLLYFSFLFFSPAHTLQCIECTPDTFGFCTETTKDCPSQYHQCASTRLVIFLGLLLCCFQLFVCPLLGTVPLSDGYFLVLEGTKFPGINAKSCALAEDCVDGSFNFGATKGVYKTKCCSGELCNHYTVSGNLKPFGMFF